MRRRFVTHPKQNVNCSASSGVPTFSIVVIDTNEVIDSTLKMSKAVMHAIHHTEATGQDTQVVKVLGPGEEQVVWTSVDNMPEYTKQSVQSNTEASSGIELDGSKLHNVAQSIMNGEYDDQINGRDEDIEWIYDSADDLASDVPAILYMLFGLEDGEDYQLMNGTSILYTDTANSLWKEVSTLLG